MVACIIGPTFYKCSRLPRSKERAQMLCLIRTNIRKGGDFNYFSATWRRKWNCCWTPISVFQRRCLVIKTEHAYSLVHERHGLLFNECKKTASTTTSPTHFRACKKALLFRNIAYLKPCKYVQSFKFSSSSLHSHWWYRLNQITSNKKNGLFTGLVYCTNCSFYCQSNSTVLLALVL